MNLADIPVMSRHLLRRLLGRLPKATPVDLTGKKIIVTGASPGSIGYITAKTLASWGAHVVVSGRSNAKVTAQALMAELKQEGRNRIVDGYDLELNNLTSVQKFAQTYCQNHGDRLDVLINNAGIHLDLMSKWTQPNLTEDNVEIHWRTNFLGTFQLINEFLPLLKKTGVEQGDARIVNVASHLHNKGVNGDFFGTTRPYNSWDAYGQSKLGVVHLALEIERKFGKSHNLHGYTLHPGSIYTNIAGKGLNGHGLILAVRNALAPVEKLILLTPEQGAQTQLKCASEPGLAGGHYYERCELGVINPEAQDALVGERLWDETENWLQKALSGGVEYGDLGNV